MTRESLKARNYLRISPIVLFVLYIWISIIPGIEKFATDEERDRNFASEIVDQFNLGQRAGVIWEGAERGQIVMDVISGRMSVIGEYDGVVYGDTRMILIWRKFFEHHATFATTRLSTGFILTMTDVPLKNDLLQSTLGIGWIFYIRSE
jgi:hypothetical protein